MSERNNTSNKHPWIWTLAAIAAILILFFIVADIAMDKYTRHNQEFEVPDFYGMQVEEAEILARENGFRLDVTDSIDSKTLARGAIFKQNPTKGSKVKHGRRIILTINSFATKQIEMPLLVGYSLRQARTELTSRGLELEKLVYVEDMATNNVLSQLYRGKSISAGTLIPSDSKITLVVGQNYSDGNASVPDVLGYTYKTAVDIVHDNSFNIARCIFDNTVQTYADSISAAVYQQSPVPSDSEVHERGSSVTLYLTKDPTKIVRKNDFSNEEDDEQE